MRKWRNCTFLHAVQRSPSLLRNKWIISASKVGTTVIEMRGSVEDVVASRYRNDA